MKHTKDMSKSVRITGTERLDLDGTPYPDGHLGWEWEECGKIYWDDRPELVSRRTGISAAELVKMRVRAAE